MKRWRGGWRVRWSRQIGIVRNKSDGNKTRDGEERREGKKEILTAAIICLLPHLSLSKQRCHHLLTSTPCYHHLGLREEEKETKFKVWDNCLTLSISVTLSEVSCCTETPPVWCWELVKTNAKELFARKRLIRSWVASGCSALYSKEKHLIHLEREKGENSEG